MEYAWGNGYWPASTWNGGGGTTAHEVPEGHEAEVEAPQSSGSAAVTPNALGPAQIQAHVAGLRYWDAT
jgi:hypothetical protein